MGGRNRGGQKRGRTQRRHFKDGRENAWKKPRGEEDAEGGGPQREAGGGWDPFVTESTVFEQYYKKQHIVPENEWDEFLVTLRKPLPAVFRVNASAQFATEIRNQIQQEFVESLKGDNEVNGEREELLKPLPWYPGELAWHLNFSRMQLRKNQTLSRVHEFLKRENEIGNITRQEAVSMVPPLFLDVQPNHRVLDMCAAPGSKTFQLLEMIHSDDKEGSLPNGLVLANDLDVQRCHLLIHQTKRMCSPNVIVTNHEAQHFPGLRKERDNGYQQNYLTNPLVDLDLTSTMEVDEEKGLVFDRVLCDVPCSGDGTIRKAPDLWRKWNAGIANGLHRLQVQIAMRGVALLRVGGRLVYSTCSLNPVENEAVVGEVLRRADGCLELMDVSNELPQLKRRPGLKTWKVRDKGLWISSYQHVNRHRAGSIVPGMFPTGKGQEDQLDPEGTQSTLDGIVPIATEGPSLMEAIDDEILLEKLEMDGDGGGEIAVLPLERCVRILPHDQDTGGFFVAVFKKVSALKVEHSTKEPLRKPIIGRKGEQREDFASRDTVKEEETEALDSAGKEEFKEQLEEAAISGNTESLRAENNRNEGVQCTGTENLEFGHDAQISVESNQKSSRVQQQGNWKGVDPVLFLKDEALISSIITFYGIKETLPLHGHLVTRSEDTSRLKRIYYVSGSVTNVMKMNFRAGEQMKITSLGLKIFERQGGKEGFSQCAFRIASEGLPVLLPHLTKQMVRASKHDFKLLLSLRTTPFTEFSDGFSTAVQVLLPGCCIVILDDGGQSNVQIGSSSVIAIGCWRGRTNMSLLIPKEEAGQLIDRLFSGDGDDLPSTKAESEVSVAEKNLEFVTKGDDIIIEEGHLLGSNDSCEQEEPQATISGALEPHSCEDKVG